MDENYDKLREKFHNLISESNIIEGGVSDADWEAVISIGTAAKIVGLSVSALRKYENEGLLKFHRTATKRRLLSRADIDRIKMIQHLINDIGLNMEGIRRILALLPCWDLKPCPDEDRQKCQATNDHMRPCWMNKETECQAKGIDCRLCNVYRFGAYATTVMKTLLHEKGKDL
jgi:MerR family transcriptional regulator/heat shock protein HspR